MRVGNGGVIFGHHWLWSLRGAGRSVPAMPCGFGGNAKTVTPPAQPK